MQQQRQQQMQIGLIPGAREAGRRMQGSSVRGDDDEGADNGQGAKGRPGDSRSDNCDGDEVVDNNEKRSLYWGELMFPYVTLGWRRAR